MFKNTRIKKLDKKEIIEGRDYVIYWMQQSQRAEYNHALEFAIEKANELELPLIVYFGITDKFPEANLRHYRFMLEGLSETGEALEKRGINLIIRIEKPHEGIVRLNKKASCVIFDMGYLNIQRKWREYAANNIDCCVYQIESDIVVPVETASQKEEYAARTLRPKILKLMDEYLISLHERNPKINSTEIDDPNLYSEDFSNIETLLDKLDIDRSVKPVAKYKGGLSEAKVYLRKFIDEKLASYDKKSNDPTLDYISNLSPYLHFGQISPVFIANAVKMSEQNGEAFIEQLVIRRELAINFCHYNHNYDSLEHFLYKWAKDTLKFHSADKREYIYTTEEFENARTHDQYWNAAQIQTMRCSALSYFSG